ncbi:MAG: lipoyl(octanoyl) transferase LipB [Desulfovibrio sp.]
MEIIDLGLIPYKDAEQIQLKKLKEVQDGTSPSTLFLLEHPKVITLGRQGGAENLHVTEEFLNAQEIELVQSTRGGNITCHYPGQLVAYPVIKVEKRKGGIRQFFYDMEEATICTLREFGIEAIRREGYPGVWADGQRKIASTGIGVKRWVTYHGLALNVSRDVTLFELITLCGINGAMPTSMELEKLHTTQDVSITVEEVKDVFKKEFQRVFADSAMAAHPAA